VKGSYLGIKRILSCHPFKFLGGGSGLNYVPKKKLVKGKFNG
jgi:putative component of membrane protein insertase Oxa1/YidC/SpoIIIJ protein YidD